MQRVCSIFLLVLAVSQPAFADKIADKKASIQKMRGDVLERLYREAPETREMIQKAAGYGVFSNLGVAIIFVSGGGGSGVVHDNKSGKDTYMNMGTAGIGLGIGIKDFRGVFIFHSSKALSNFLEYGWDFSGQADAAAKSGDKGDEGSIAGTVVNGASIYQLTENGLALQATGDLAKFWKYGALNE